MEVVGKIIQVLPESNGVSKAGKPWKKREYVIEIQDGGQFPQKFVFDFFGDRADQYPLQVGQVVKLSFDIMSREYNGRWYTNVSAWRAEEVNGAEKPAQNNAEATNTPANEYNAPVIPPVDLAPSGPDDDLPF